MLFLLSGNKTIKVNGTHMPGIIFLIFAALFQDLILRWFFPRWINGNIT